MPTLFASSRTLRQRSSNTMLWIFYTISVLVTSFGRSLRCSSWHLVRSLLWRETTLDGLKKSIFLIVLIISETSQKYTLKALERNSNSLRCYAR